ncbi:MAG: PTS galactitol transporter subunit IIB [Eubacteriales bacterium]|nr:PTS galactitol transporter subunit IIB [Eubacteriales bacterium]
MRKINVLVACGGGIATSTFAAEEIKKIASECGVDVDVTKHPLIDVPAVAKEYDVCYVTSKYSQDVGTPIYQVNGLITGMGEEEAIERIQKSLKEINEKING